jgi:predicted outer membrane lipoprotein
MIDVALSWLLKVILDWAFARAKAEATELLEKLKRERERKEINEENVKKYNEAKGRKERIEEALRLINRSKR